MSKITLGILDKKRQVEVVRSVSKDFSKGKYLVFVSVSSSVDIIIESMKKINPKLENVLLIDCISKKLDLEDSELKNCVYIDGPENLTAISIAINKAVKELPGKKIVLIDSLSTMLVYNEENVIARFVNFVINKLNSKEVDFMFLSLKPDQNRNIIKQIEYYSDEVKKW